MLCAGDGHRHTRHEKSLSDIDGVAERHALSHVAWIDVTRRTGVSTVIPTEEAPSTLFLMTDVCLKTLLDTHSLCEHLLPCCAFMLC